MSTQDVADRTELKLGMIRSFERAKAEPDIEELAKLAAALEVPATYLLWGLRASEFPPVEESVIERLETGERDSDGRYLLLGS